VTERKTAQEIDAEAAEWAARIDRAPLTAEDEEAFRLWTEGDPRRLGAFGRLRAIWLATERAKALGPDFGAAVHAAPAEGGGGMARRRVVGFGLAAAASVGVASIAGLKWLSRGPRYTTRRGQTRVVALGDSSVVTLNTQSELVVDFTERERRVSLLQGEARFDVAKSPLRPFIVEAGDTVVRVVGTSFTVRRLDATPVQVLVREGIVEVSMRGAAASPAVRLTANSRAVAMPALSNIATSAVAPAELQRELAWQDGRLAFEGQSLGEAATEFARYSDIRIVIADPGLAREEIAGLFRATDPVGFAQTVAVSLKARVEIGENEVRLTR
jgi:transmembrane sensor